MTVASLRRSEGLKDEAGSMKRAGGVVAFVAAGIVLAGCGGDSGVSETVTVTTASSTTSSSSSSSTTSAEPSDLALGKAMELPDMTFTVSQVEKSASEYSQLSADQQWWSVMVEGCAKSDEISVSWLAWSVQGDDGGTYPSSNSTWDDFPRPQYPVMSSLANGKCAKGWIMVALNSGVAPESVTYANSQGDSASWVVD